MKKLAIVLSLLALAVLAACNTSPAPTPVTPTSQPDAAAGSAVPAAGHDAAPVHVSQAPAATAPKTATTPPKTVTTPPRPAPATPVVASQPAPPPRPRTVTLPVGTLFDLEIVDAVSSQTSAVGDVTSARIVQDVTVDGEVIVPAGSIVSGTVAEANPANRFAGISSLGLHFDTLTTPRGQRHPVDFTYRLEKRGEKKKDAATIGGAAVGGAILGRILKDSDRAEGTKEGAIAGAVIGTAIAGATKGQDIELPAGTPVQVELTAPVTVTP